MRLLDRQAWIEQIMGLPERAARPLVAIGDDDFYLNAGGDIALGLAAAPAADPAQRQPWRIGVEDPYRPGTLLGVLPLTRGGVATSGPAQRGYHIVDPHTGQPATEVMSATVIGPSLLWADVCRGLRGFAAVRPSSTD